MIKNLAIVEKYLDSCYYPRIWPRILRFFQSNFVASMNNTHKISLAQVMQMWQEWNFSQQPLDEFEKTITKDDIVEIGYRLFQYDCGILSKNECFRGIRTI